MSYDITIHSDQRSRESISLESLIPFLEKELQLVGQAPNYHLERKVENIYFEIDVCKVNEEGDIIENENGNNVNQIKIHIPAAFFDTSNKVALTTAIKIAEKINWQIYDEQTGEYLGKDIDGLDISNHEDLENVLNLPLSKNKVRLRLFLYIATILVALSLVVMGVTYLLIIYVIDPVLK